MVGSWCPPITEVHGLAPHGQAVRSVFVSSRFSWKGELGLSDVYGQDRSDDWPLAALFEVQGKRVTSGIDRFVRPARH